LPDPEGFALPDLEGLRDLPGLETCFENLPDLCFENLPGLKSCFGNLPAL